ncbi:hypothetical protein OUZ54_18645 [Mycobacterium avium subsp. paratuberculosis]|uniref:hypothetical protein n=1 Tax=Mycobacterium avium TaxID=1764 RepID=UPI00227D1B30|nr:hypothetical protein [Mycobacterium avium]WAI53792.1 hypothetical protein OUZ54_18645 [Mycobacterium avium subsp. paratuberculosis]
MIVWSVMLTGARATLHEELARGLMRRWRCCGDSRFKTLNRSKALIGTGRALAHREQVKWGSRDLHRSMPTLRQLNRDGCNRRHGRLQKAPLAVEPDTGIIPIAQLTKASGADNHEAVVGRACS